MNVAAEKTQIKEFPIVKPGTGEVAWYKIENKKLIVARQPQGLKNPSLAELVINMTDERSQFSATIYKTNGEVSQITGDEVADRITTATKVASWCWYFESAPIDVVGDGMSPQVTLTLLLWCKVQCANCKRVILPHQCALNEDGTRFMGECAECPKK